MRSGYNTMLLYFYELYNYQCSEPEKKTGFRIGFGFQNFAFSGLDWGLDFFFFGFSDLDFGFFGFSGLDPGLDFKFFGSKLEFYKSEKSEIQTRIQT